MTQSRLTEGRNLAILFAIIIPAAMIGLILGDNNFVYFGLVLYAAIMLIDAAYYLSKKTDRPSKPQKILLMYLGGLFIVICAVAFLIYTH